MLILLRIHEFENCEEKRVQFNFSTQISFPLHKYVGNAQQNHKNMSFSARQSMWILVPAFIPIDGKGFLNRRIVWKYVPKNV